MKKFFTFVAAAVAALTVNAEVMSFPHGSATAEGSTFTTANLTFTVTTDTDGKLAIDSNKCYFDPAAPIKFATRLKTGGKSSSKIALTLTASESGTLKVYARTGSNSATDRNLVLTQNGTELLNHVMLESEKTENVIVEGETDPQSVYPVLSTAVAAGDIVVTFPVGSINFYGFELIAGEGPSNQDSINNTGTPLHFNALTAEDFTNIVNGEATTYTMDGVDGPSINYTGADAAEMGFDCRGMHFSYKNSAAKSNAVKCGTEFIQFDAKNFIMTVSGVTAGQTVNFYVSAKGSTDATFMMGETQLGTAAKASGLDSYTVLSYVAAAAGDVVVKETTGGFRLSKVEITNAPVQKLAYNVTVPAGTKECYIAGEMNNWGFTKMNKVDGTHFTIELVGATEAMGYKYTCGADWAYVEKDAQGGEIGNRTYSENDVVAAWAAIPVVEYAYPTIAEKCNYIDFQVVETGTAVPSATPAAEEGGEPIYSNTYAFANGTAVYGSAISTADCSWNIKDDYNTKFPIYNTNDTVLFGSQFRGVSGAKIVLGEFEVEGTDAAIEVYWQPNGTSLRGLTITNLYDETNTIEDLIDFTAGGKNVCVVTVLPIEEGYYDKEFEIVVSKNTINIAGINIVGLKPTSIRPAAAAVKAQKSIENGRVVIRRNGVRFDALGQQF